jgi:SAM-dependent methyltransferase
MSERVTSTERPAPLVPPPGPATRPAHLLPAHVYARDRDWNAYFDALGHLPARDTLLRAIARFDAEGVLEAAQNRRSAIDLGCGDGRDSLELIARGWHVLAIDSSAEGVARLTARARELGLPGYLTTRHAAFEGLTLGATDLVNASFALPFCAPSAFPALWAQIEGSIRVGGRFAGQFFGPNDDWASLPDRSHHSEAQVRDDLLQNFEIEHWQEEDRPTTNAEHPKRWHLFHVVARKRRAV